MDESTGRVRAERFRRALEEKENRARKSRRAYLDFLQPSRVPDRGPTAPQARTTVVNVYGGPRSGKTRTVRELGRRLVAEGHRVRTVTEVNATSDDLPLGDQLTTLALVKRELREATAEGVDYVLVDHPLLLAAVYGAKEGPGLARLAVDCYVAVDGVNADVVLERDFDYPAEGARQTEAEARTVGEAVETFLERMRIPFLKTRTSTAVDEVTRLLKGLRERGEGSVE